MPEKPLNRVTYKIDSTGFMIDFAWNKHEIETLNMGRHSGTNWSIHASIEPPLKPSEVQSFEAALTEKYDKRDGTTVSGIIVYSTEP